VACVQRAPDFQRDDVFYVDAARELLRHHFYGFDGRAETNMPPGMSGFLALLCLAGVCGHVMILRVMAGLQTAGLLTSYALLRRLASPRVAAIICLLLASSPIYFGVATQEVLAYFPYLVTTMCALLIAHRMESLDAEATNARLGWLTTALAVMCAMSVLLATVGAAMAGALLVRAALLTRARRPRIGVALACAGLAGVVTQLLWMGRTPAPLEWPIAGFPRPYVQQLLVKSGNEPELGMASVRDVFARIGQNALDRSAFLDQLLAHHWIDAHWASFFAVCALVVVVAGWLSSVLRSGGEVHDWYFAGHEIIYLLWPWQLEPRFVLPIAPLACLYLWRGLRVIGEALERYPRRVGAIALPMSALLALGAIAWTYQLGGSAVPGVQAKASIVGWSVCAVLSAWLLRQRPSTSSSNSVTDTRVRRALRQPTSIVLGAVLGAVVVMGIRGQLRVARENLDIQSPLNILSPDVEAAEWLAAHSEPRAVVMARHEPVVRHYAHRRVVWFPPSSDAQMLMSGIQRLGVRYIVVVHRTENYYLPSDDISFARLVSAFPTAFGQVYRTARVQIFETTE